jgi:deoxyribodipyrimidine photo-lyase
VISAVSEKVSVVDHCVGDAGQGSVPAANRAAALCRLHDFVAEAVCRYARMRNVDRGPGAPAHVSQLSPHVRHRLVLESELIEAALARHGFAKVEKFTQEVFWRSYWKGWLELRPSVWARYRQALSEHLRAVEGGEFAAAYARACEGRTGIDCFDAWIAELYATGYLHNHARMWFASIWVHTLGLPWELGADLFLRHLLDGDPASNTLSWRWVVGLQTAGKTYLARPDNIARYTEGRFAPRGLAARATVPPMEPAPAPRALAPLPPPPEGPAALLLTEEDLHPESLPLADAAVVAVGAAHAVAERSPRAVSPQVVAFTGAAQADALARASAHFGCADETLSCLETEPVIAWCRRLGVRCVVTAYAPVGPAQERLHALFQPLADAGIALHPVRRAWDEVTWPLATRGFFAFAQRIPELLRNPRLFQSAAGKGHRK